MSTAKTYRDQMESLVATIADDVVAGTTIPARYHPDVAATIRQTMAAVETKAVPDDGVLMGIVKVRDEGALEVALTAGAHPSREYMRETKVRLRKDPMSPSFLVGGMVEHLPGMLAKGADDPKTQALAYGAMGLLLASNRAVRDEVAELRGDPEVWPLILLVEAPEYVPVAGVLIVYGVPRPSVAAPPSFKDLMTELEQGGTDDE